MNIRKIVADMLRSKADAIEANGEADGIDFAIFAYDIIDETRFECLETAETADESYGQYCEALSKGHTVTLEVSMSSQQLGFGGVAR